MNDLDQDAIVGGEAFDLGSIGLEEAAAKAAAIFVSIYRGLEDRPVAPTKPTWNYKPAISVARRLCIIRLPLE